MDVKLKYFPLRAFLSHTRFHCRHGLLFILQDGILSIQQFATKVRNWNDAGRNCVRHRISNQAAIACIFLRWSNGCFVFSTLYMITNIFRVMAKRMLHRCNWLSICCSKQTLFLVKRRCWRLYCRICCNIPSTTWLLLIKFFCKHSAIHCASFTHPLRRSCDRELVLSIATRPQPISTNVSRSSIRLGVYAIFVYVKTTCFFHKIYRN